MSALDQPSAPPAPPAPGPADPGVQPDAEPADSYGPADSEIWAARGLGAAMALAVVNPVVLGDPKSVFYLVVALLALIGLLAVVWFAAPPVVARPVSGNLQWNGQLSRHRNTVLAVGFVLLAPVTGPPVWLMACDAALLLAYLLFVDAAAAGPPGAAQLRNWPLVVTALAAQGLALTGAVMTITGADSWSRLLGAVLLAAVVGASAVALRRR